jgi:hypothetical protein
MQTAITNEMVLALTKQLSRDAIDAMFQGIGRTAIVETFFLDDDNVFMQAVRSSYDLAPWVGECESEKVFGAL